MHGELNLLHPIAPQQSDTLVLDALTRYVAQSGTRVGEKLPPERVLAEGLAVSRNTVRSQLQAVFAKTGTNRQGDLVRLLLSSAATLAQRAL